MNKIFTFSIIVLSIKLSTQQYNIDLSNLESNSMYKDIMNCVHHEDISTCSSVKMTSGLYQCCRANMVMTTYSQYDGSYSDSDTTDICNIWVNQDFTDDQIESMQETYQEFLAFFTYVYKLYMPSMKMTYTCPKKTYNLNFLIL